MKKHHYVIISITFIIYGFVFYQKYYAGPDIVDYYRDNGAVLDNFIDAPESSLNKTSKMYYSFRPKGLWMTGLNEYYIYFKKDKSELKLNCKSSTDYGEVTGVIVIGENNDEEYFYYKTIQSIYAYKTKESSNKGMKVKCYPN